VPGMEKVDGKIEKRVNTITTNRYNLLLKSGATEVKIAILLL